MITIIPQSVSVTSQVLTANIEEKLCKPYCVNATLQPVVDVNYTITETNLVGTVLYVKVKAQGTISYVTSNGSRMRTIPFAEQFTTSFAGATSASTVTIAQADGIVKPAYLSCCAAKGVSALNVITLTFTA